MELRVLVLGQLPLIHPWNTTVVRTHPDDDLCIFMRAYRLTRDREIHESSRRKVTSKALTLFSGVMHGPHVGKD